MRGKKCDTHIAQCANVTFDFVTLCDFLRQNGCPQIADTITSISGVATLRVIMDAKMDAAKNTAKNAVTNVDVDTNDAKVVPDTNDTKVVITTNNINIVDAAIDISKLSTPEEHLKLEEEHGRIVVLRNEWLAETAKLVAETLHPAVSTEAARREVNAERQPNNAEHIGEVYHNRNDTVLD